MALPILNKSVISQFNLGENISLPEVKHFTFPERIIQFGSGVLLRGLPDYYVDKANKAGVFNGRIVVVKSTAHGDNSIFEQQDYLYTQAIAGIENGEIIQKNIINASISRILQAQTQWEAILECATNPDIEIVFSNTTEQGLVYEEETVFDVIPNSFPGKLLVYLLHRFRYFIGDIDKGLTIIPTELLDNNGDLLKGFLLKLASYNKLESEFISWLDLHNTFCNSLVDRIVPGRPQASELTIWQDILGYKDELLLLSEPFGLWAIEGDKRVEEKLSFAQTDSGVKIIPDIKMYKELKLRLLNGSHILSCGKAILGGFVFVKDAMGDQSFSQWIDELMDEISLSIPMDISEDMKLEFAQSVKNRFANPFLDHQWLSITLNYSTKLKIRAVPLLLEFYRKNQYLPEKICLGFSTYLILSIPNSMSENQYYVMLGTQRFEVKDRYAAQYFQWSLNFSREETVFKILSDKEIWGENLTTITGFYEKVLHLLNALSITLPNSDVPKDQCLI